MTVADMGLVLCAAAALANEEEEEEKKERRRNEKTIASKKEKKVKDWLKRSGQLGHNRTLLYKNWTKEILPASTIPTSCHTLTL